MKKKSSQKPKKKMLKKIKSASCSFQNPWVPLSKKNSVYPIDETALCIWKIKRSNFTYDFRCLFFFTKCGPKICLLLLILPKTTSQVWGKGKFRNNGKAPLYSLYWWHKATTMLSPRWWHSHPCVQGASPKLCRTAVWLHMRPAEHSIHGDLSWGKEAKLQSTWVVS